MLAGVSTAALRARLLAPDEVAIATARAWLGSRIVPTPASQPDDLVIAVTSCRDGVSGLVSQQWAQEPYDCPRLVLALDLDDAVIDLTELEAMCRRALDSEVLARWLPVLHDDESVIGTLDLLCEDVEAQVNGTVTCQPADAGHRAVAAEFIDEARTLVATGATTDLFDAFVDDAPITCEQWNAAFVGQVRDTTLFPLLATSPEAVSRGHLDSLLAALTASAVGTADD